MWGSESSDRNARVPDDESAGEGVAAAEPLARCRAAAQALGDLYLETVDLLAELRADVLRQC